MFKKTEEDAPVLVAYQEMMKLQAELNNPKDAIPKILEISEKLESIGKQLKEYMNKGKAVNKIKEVMKYGRSLFDTYIRGYLSSFAASNAYQLSGEYKDELKKVIGIAHGYSDKLLKTFGK